MKLLKNSEIIEKKVKIMKLLKNYKTIEKKVKIIKLKVKK